MFFAASIAGDEKMYTLYLYKLIRFEKKKSWEFKVHQSDIFDKEDESVRKH
jgi:hypothetical protein